MKDRDPRTIPVADLVIGTRYKGRGRNFDEGTWTGTGFEGFRFKFGHRLKDEELHWDACTHHGTFQPYEVAHEEKP